MSIKTILNDTEHHSMGSLATTPKNNQPKRLRMKKACMMLGAASLLSMGSLAQAAVCNDADGNPLYVDSANNSLEGTAPTHVTRYPIVLIHGAFGDPGYFDDLMNMLTVEAESIDKVIELHTVELPGMAGGEGLGIALAAEIERVFDEDIIPRWECEGQVGPAPDKVHLIAHSLGSRAARAYISQYGGDERVASATLIAGDDAPSPIVDLAVGLSLYENVTFVQGVWDVLDDFVSGVLVWATNEEGWDLSEGIIELGTNGYEGPNGFLERFPDVEGFPYTWHGGRIRSKPVWNLSFWANWAGDHLLNEFGPIVTAGYGLYHTLGAVTGAEYDNKESDGVVTLNMAGAGREDCAVDQALDCFKLWEGESDSVGVNHFGLVGAINVNIVDIHTMYDGIIEGMLQVED